MSNFVDVIDTSGAEKTVLSIYDILCDFNFLFATLRLLIRYLITLRFTIKLHYYISNTIFVVAGIIRRV